MLWAGLLAWSVFAYTITTSQSGPLVIQHLLPFSTKSSPSLSARRRMSPMTSLPAPGSDIARAPHSSPAHRGGSSRAFCSADPFWPRLLMQRFDWLR